MSPAQLSQLISGKRPLTPKQATKLVHKLNLSPNQARELLDATGSIVVQRPEAPDNYQALSEDEFRAISDWHYYAILSLADVDRNRADTRWIARRLNIPEADALEAFHRLRHLGFIRIAGDGFRPGARSITVAVPGPGSAAIRKYHKRNLDLAKDVIDSVDPERRDFSAITMAVNPKHLAQAKKMIHELRRRVCAELEHGPKSEVYTLAVQLFPLTELSKK